MRLTSEQARENRQLILKTASRMFRLHGLEDVSVADIMKQSGFTHGGFYNHFDSKEELAAEAIAYAFVKSTHNLSEKFGTAKTPKKGFETVISEYLSPGYRDSSTGGCPAAALPSDSARNGNEIQMAFAEGIESYLDVFSAQMTGTKQESRQQAVALLSGLVGALMLSRAVKKCNPQLSDELLHSTRKSLSK
ncbi:TetR/AcrR family transcriptional regulator [Granulicella mallensis]|uniref:TetR/AcrR family transcriptional repressor of nem operon n=1 Tax=Granulicella mallensis TaxID=940614 RepID=A0A7W7ZN53_9BACT|nr:TetR/AcrR family transcriptional regulator [Granulicella mallensis]MBB5062654.1 TetR/AcrR family transcriptional repressor of nem operon [Granulicella mallensis]